MGCAVCVWKTPRQTGDVKSSSSIFSAVAVGKWAAALWRQHLLLWHSPAPCHYVSNQHALVYPVNWGRSSDSPGSFARQHANQCPHCAFLGCAATSSWSSLIFFGASGCQVYSPTHSPPSIRSPWGCFSPQYLTIMLEGGGRNHHVLSYMAPEVKKETEKSGTAPHP